MSTMTESEIQAADAEVAAEIRAEKAPAYTLAWKMVGDDVHLYRAILLRVDDAEDLPGGGDIARQLEAAIGAMSAEDGIQRFTRTSVQEKGDKTHGGKGYSYELVEVSRKPFEERTATPRQSSLTTTEQILKATRTAVKAGTDRRTAFMSAALEAGWSEEKASTVYTLTFEE